MATALASLWGLPLGEVGLLKKGDRVFLRLDLPFNDDDGDLREEEWGATAAATRVVGRAAAVGRVAAVAAAAVELAVRGWEVTLF